MRYGEHYIQKISERLFKVWEKKTRDYSMPLSLKKCLSSQLGWAKSSIVLNKQVRASYRIPDNSRRLCLRHYEWVCLSWFLLYQKKIFRVEIKNWITLANRWLSWRYSKNKDLYDLLNYMDAVHLTNIHWLGASKCRTRVRSKAPRRKLRGKLKLIAKRKQLRKKSDH